MRTIHKFTFKVADTVFLTMPKGAKIIRVEAARSDFGYDNAQLWAEVDTDQPMEKRTIYVRGTGHAFPEALFEREVHHIGTYLHGPFVWHVMEAACE